MLKRGSEVFVQIKCFFWDLVFLGLVNIQIWEKQVKEEFAGGWYFIVLLFGDCFGQFILGLEIFSLGWRVFCVEYNVLYRIRRVVFKQEVNAVVFLSFWFFVVCMLSKNFRFVQSCGFILWLIFFNKRKVKKEFKV